VAVKRTIFWVVRLCSPVEFSERFGGTYCHYLQGGRVSQARKQQEEGGRKASTRLYAVASHKIIP
jgi:hypothetical protein